MPLPQVLVNTKVPRPSGLAGDSTFALGATVNLTVANYSAFGSIIFTVIAPDGATTAFGSSTPARPFSTTLGPLNQVGTYLLRAVGNGDPAQTATFAITVLATNGLRIPAAAESVEWDATKWWHPDLVAALKLIGAGGGAGRTVAQVFASGVSYSIASATEDVVLIAGGAGDGSDVTLPIHTLATEGEQHTIKAKRSLGLWNLVVHADVSIENAGTSYTASAASGGGASVTFEFMGGQWAVVAIYHAT